jgi:hypothetical protein
MTFIQVDENLHLTPGRVRIEDRPRIAHAGEDAE